MKALFKPISAALLASFLAACSLIPPAQQSSQRQVNAQVQTAADTGSKPPEKVTFPNMVKTTPLDTNLPADKNDQLNAALEQALAEKPGEEGFRIQGLNLPQVFIVRFMAQAKNLKEQVKIPENGEFKLVLEAGTGKKLEILDGDGSDGQAAIRLPQQTYETLLHLQGPWKPNSSLEVSDDLYYVKDTLTSKQGKLLDLNRWFLLGVRPLPVPSDWYNPDGQKLVLKFKTDTVKEFQMAWWTTNQQAAYPPGIKQIGPAGGTVELPGVAQITIKPNALKSQKVITLHQIKTVFPADSGFMDTDGTPYPYEFISPVVKIEPLGEVLDGAMEIRLTTDLQRLGNNSAGILRYMRSENPLQANNRWDYITTAWPSRDKVYNYPVNLPGITNKFGYFSRFIDAKVSPKRGAISLPPKEEFKINSIQKQNPCMVIFSDLNVEESQKIESYCHTIFNHYVNLFDNAKAKHYPYLYFGANRPVAMS
jgi:hypothetical protein